VVVDGVQCAEVVSDRDVYSPFTTSNVELLGTFNVGEGVRRHREYAHFVCNGNLTGTVQDVRNVWSTRHEPDHCLRVIELGLGGK